MLLDQTVPEPVLTPTTRRAHRDRAQVDGRIRFRKNHHGRQAALWNAKLPVRKSPRVGCWADNEIVLYMASLTACGALVFTGVQAAAATEETGMTDRFVALPVGQGDAFFFQRGEFTALVDGGRSKARLPKLFSGHVGLANVDVLACTHNDADHANGVLGFLKEPGLHCGEVWLPALWTNRLADIVNGPEEFLRELHEDISEHPRPEPDPDVERPIELEAIGERVSERKDSYPESGRASDRHVSPVPTDLPDIVPRLEIHGSRRFAPLLWHPAWPAGFKLFLQALGAAKNIRKIFTTCCHDGVPIRWFEFNRKAASGGQRGFLEPLNARQVGTGSLPRLSALEYLALTTANRESLTFCSPQSDDFPGVVFSADSDLRFPQCIPWKHGMIVTTPHHGSNSNKAAYGRPARDNFDSSNLIWVRSDGKFRKRPCPAYLALPANAKYCTICNRANTLTQKRCVQFTAVSGKWKPGNRIATCKCT